MGIIVILNKVDRENFVKWVYKEMYIYNVEIDSRIFDLLWLLYVYILVS